MVIFTTIGILFCIVFIIYIFFNIINYFVKIKNKEKLLMDFKNKIEDEDLKKSWINFLKQQYNRPFHNEPHNFF